VRRSPTFLRRSPTCDALDAAAASISEDVALVWHLIHRVEHVRDDRDSLIPLPPSLPCWRLRLGCLGRLSGNAAGDRVCVLLR
jgi:hypothetical protein